MCGLTLRSSGAPTAGHQARAGGTLYIFTGPGLASCRRRPLSSNVRLHKRIPSCTKRSLISYSFCMQPSSFSSSAGWSLSWSATRRAGIGSMRLGSGLHTLWPSQWLCFKLGLAWSALSQRLSRGCVFKVVHRATTQASSNTGFNVCSSTRLQSGYSPRCTPFSPQRSLQPGGATRPRGLPELLLWHPKLSHPVPPPPVKPNPSLNRTRYGRRSKPGAQRLRHCRAPGLHRLPPRAG